MAVASFDGDGSEHVLALRFVPSCWSLRSDVNVERLTRKRALAGRLFGSAPCLIEKRTQAQQQLVCAVLPSAIEPGFGLLSAVASCSLWLVAYLASSASGSAAAVLRLVQPALNFPPRQKSRLALDLIDRLHPRTPWLLHHLMAMEANMCLPCALSRAAGRCEAMSMWRG